MRNRRTKRGTTLRERVVENEFLENLGNHPRSLLTTEPVLLLGRNCVGKLEWVSVMRILVYMSAKRSA